MAFFKFRFPGFKAGTDAVAPVPPESVDGLRRRARHRLIGAAVLVLAAVIGFPMLFDTQPRPVAVDVPIQIPDRAKVKPLAMASPEPAAPVASQPVATPKAPASAPPAPPAVPAVASPPAQVAAPSSLSPREEIVPKESVPKVAKPSVNGDSVAINKEASRAPVTAPKPEPRPEPKPKPEPRKEVQSPPKVQITVPADDGSRARALLDGKEAPKSAVVDAGRFIVQVGAFSDMGLARETRLKVERSGLTTYTQVTETRDGKRIRVRVGPFGSRAEADKAAAKIRGLNLPAAILTL